jgi:hypothetical protein
MKSSSLAERLEEWEATMRSLQMDHEPTMQKIAAPEGVEAPEAMEQPARPRAPRRTSRARTIETRDQGLRSFRVF